MSEQNSLLLEEKNIAVTIILSIVTFGIYYIIWTYGICKKIKLMAGEEPNCGGEIVCLVLVPFYAWYWLYTRSKKLSVAAGNCGVVLEDRSVLNLILAICSLGIVSMALIQADLNTAAQAFQNASVAR